MHSDVLKCLLWYLFWQISADKHSSIHAVANWPACWNDKRETKSRLFRNSKCYAAAPSVLENRQHCVLQHDCNMHINMRSIIILEVMSCEYSQPWSCGCSFAAMAFLRLYHLQRTPVGFASGFCFVRSTSGAPCGSSEWVAPSLPGWLAGSYCGPLPISVPKNSNSIPFLRF
jgi:hypothetical protein